MNAPFNGPQLLLQQHTHAGARCPVCGAILPPASPNLEVFYAEGNAKVCSLSCAARLEAGLQANPANKQGLAARPMEKTC